MENVSRKNQEWFQREAARLTSETGKLVSAEELSKASFSDKLQQFLAGIDVEIHEVSRAGSPRAEAGRLIEEESRAERETARRKMLLERCRVPKRYDRASVLHFEPRNSEEIAARIGIIRWMEDLAAGKGLTKLIFGAHGTGKTYLGCGVVLDSVAALRSALYVTAADYTGMIRESYRDDSPEPESFIRARYASTSILVMDEIGREVSSEAEKRYLFQLVNDRYNAMLPTLFITNLSLKEFGVFMGEAIMERLREGGGGFLEFNWPSRRTT